MVVCAGNQRGPPSWFYLVTILAVFLKSPEQAIIATDSEVWQNGSVTRYEPKLVVNTLIAAAGCGSGYSAIVDAASAVLQNAVDFDAAVAAIPSALRTAATKFGSALDKNPEPLHAEYVAAGWSKSASRVLAWRFPFSHFFSPVLAPCHLSPNVTLPHDGWTPGREGDVVCLARRQIAVLREMDAKSGEKGALVVADVRRNYLSVLSVDDFDADAVSRFNNQDLAA